MSELLKDLNITPEFNYFGVIVDEDLHDEIQLLWPDHSWVSTINVGSKFRKFFSMIRRAQPHVAFGVLIACLEWLARTRPEWQAPMVKGLRLYADRIEQGQLGPEPLDNRRPGIPVGTTTAKMIEENHRRKRGE